MSNMNTTIIPFDFNGSNIRVVTINEEPWFVAKDVLDSLKYPNGSRTYRINQLDSDEKLVLKIKTNPTGTPNTNMVSESGLYKLVMWSNKPQAKPFQDWVTKIVLPAIRKDGAYIMGEEKVTSGEMSEDEFVLKAMQILQGKPLLPVSQPPTTYPRIFILPNH